MYRRLASTSLPRLRWTYLIAEQCHNIVFPTGATSQHVNIMFNYVAHKKRSDTACMRVSARLLARRYPKFASNFCNSGNMSKYEKIPFHTFGEPCEDSYDFIHPGNVEMVHGSQGFCFPVLRQKPVSCEQ
jgi:hypothetical protein